MSDKSSEAQEGKSRLSKVARIEVTQTQDGKAVRGRIVFTRNYVKVVEKAIEKSGGSG